MIAGDARPGSGREQDTGTRRSSPQGGRPVNADTAMTTPASIQADPVARAAEVAQITGRTPAACRQLASSARRRIRASRAPAAPAAQRADLVRDFKKAWEAKDIGALIGLLDPAATVIADGGGLVPAALRPVEGGAQIARYLADLAGRAPSLTILERTVNGQPGLVAQQDGITVTVFAFDVAGGRIKRIWAVRNPDKLRPWTAR